MVEAGPKYETCEKVCNDVYEIWETPGGLRYVIQGSDCVDIVKSNACIIPH